ncbi:MAG: DUF4167 domain-containing protein [Natronohydrobacter sp.]|nr:DUF4167 domain-containing protein [Natronohydrobacter sp.]
MRSPNKRSRSKSNRPKTLGNIVNRVFDSSGPEGKVRGTPQQIIEKYQVLARDAQLSNDRVAAENFQQHAEHYTRMLAQAQRELQAEQDARRQNNDERNRQPYEERGQDRVHDRGGERGQDRGQDRGQERGQGQNAAQNGGRRNEPRRHYDEAGSHSATPRETVAQDAFSVQDTTSAADEGTLVETPESKTLTETQRAPASDNVPPVAAAPAVESAAPQSAESQGTEPQSARKPRAPRAPRAPRQPAAATSAAVSEADEAAKPRRNIRKPRKPAGTPSDEVTSSAAE